MTNYIIYIVAGVFVILAAVLIPLLIRKMRKKEETEALYWDGQNRWLVETFDNFDVAVYGFRGSGKDVIFAHAINLKGAKHYSNIFYNADTEVRDIKDLNVGGNEYPAFINGTVKRFEPNFEEGYHFFISDAGVYLGCQYNKELCENYGELPIHLALRRHLYDSHVHTNSQALNRPWDKIREQQGAFIHCLGVKNYGEFLIVSAITYTKYESALACLPPTGGVDRKGKPDKYDVLRDGEIAERWFKVPTESLTYDTRHFKTILLSDMNKEESTQNARATVII